MIVFRATVSEVLTDQERIKLSISTNSLSGPVPRHTSVTAVLKSLVQYSKTIDSSYDVSFQEACVTDIASDLVLSGFIRGSIKSSYCRYVCVPELVRRFPDALRLVEKLIYEGASKNSSATRGFLGVTRLDSAVLSSADEHSVLLYIEAAAARTRD